LKLKDGGLKQGETSAIMQIEMKKNNNFKNLLHKVAVPAVRPTRTVHRDSPAAP
jgi:RNA recognition motif-containing protein